MRYSIVIPIYNEQDNIIPLVDELEWVMKAYDDAWECIFVDDGSTDSSIKVLKTIAKPFLRIVPLKKNYGQTSALAAGIRAACGEWIITLDGDGQNDPRDIPQLIERAESGSCDLICGIRQKRQDPCHKKIISKLANGVRRRVLNDNTQDTGCSLKIFRASCFQKLPTFNGMHRFIPALFQIAGFACEELPVHHRERRSGKSKYHLFNRGFRLLFDLLAVAWMKRRRLSYEVKHD